MLFDSNGIEDSGAQISIFIQRCTALTCLSIRNTRLTDVGLVAISKGIESGNLVDFNLSDNLFSDLGAMALFKTISGSTLKVVQLKNIRLGREGRVKLDEIASGQEIKFVE